MERDERLENKEDIRNTHLNEETEIEIPSWHYDVLKEGKEMFLDEAASFIPINKLKRENNLS